MTACSEGAAGAVGALGAALGAAGTAGTAGAAGTGTGMAGLLQNQKWGLGMGVMTDVLL